MSTFHDDYRSGLEIKYQPFAQQQEFFCQHVKPRVGDVIETAGPRFVVTSVFAETSSLYHGFCTKCDDIKR